MNPSSEAKPESKEYVTHDAVLREMFSYYRDQTIRRWQYFTTVLIIQGIAASSWNNIKHDLMLAVVGGGICLTTSCLLMLISRIRYTIQSTAEWINAVSRANLVSTGPQGFFSVRGVTIWVYLPLVFVFGIWIVILFVHPVSGGFSRATGISLCMLSIMLAFKINWTVPKCNTKLVLNGKELADPPGEI